MESECFLPTLMVRLALMHELLSWTYVTGWREDFDCGKNNW